MPARVEVALVNVRGGAGVGRVNISTRADSERGLIGISFQSACCGHHERKFELEGVRKNVLTLSTK